MSWLDLRTGYRCNNRCRFCDQAGRAGEAPLDALIAVLRANRGDGDRADGVWLAGGEIALRPDLPRLVAAAREAGYARVGIQTNGRILAAPGAAASLRKAGLTDAVVALHAPVAGLHDWLTGEAGSFRQAVLGLKRLREAGVAVRVASVVTRSATEVLPALARLVVDAGAEGHRWIAARPPATPDLEPRFPLLQRPLLAALDVSRDARVDAETVGVPLCFLPGHLSAAADRRDAPATVRAFPAGLSEEAAPARRQGPPCAACTLAHVCAGPTEAYAARWGWDEFVPVGGTVAPVGERLSLDVSDATTRVLRQRLVRAATAGVKVVAFAGDHPALPALVKEAERLGMAVEGA